MFLDKSLTGIKRSSLRGLVVTTVTHNNLVYKVNCNRLFQLQIYNKESSTYPDRRLHKYY